MTQITPPVNQQELLERANNITGKTLQQLANMVSMPVPQSMKKAKGWVGYLIEKILGANATNIPGPDFIKLGIELKTIPIGDNGRPKESTFICVVQLDPKLLALWSLSLVKKKLSHVLWVPVEASHNIPIPLRRIGSPVLWKPSKKQEQQLQQDWQDICDLIAMGEIDKVSSAMGKYLQIRPKALNAKSLMLDKNQVKDKMDVLPRGFYLRTRFTSKIIKFN